MVVRLVTFSKSGAAKEFAITNGSFVIGRKSDADLRVPVSDVSREHCRLSIRDNNLVIRDLNSTNGTFVNDQQVSEATLSPGDRLSIGPVTFMVQIDGVPKDLKPPAGPPKSVAKPAVKADSASATQPPPATKDDMDDIDSALDLDDLDLEDLSDLDIDTASGKLDDSDVLDEIEEIDELEELSEDDLIADDEQPKKKKGK